MKYKSQIAMIRDFIEEEIEDSDAGNGHVKGNQFLHYWTPILEKDGELFIFNATRYSLATGQIQKAIKAALDGKDYKIVKKVEENYKGSLKAFL